MKDSDVMLRIKVDLMTRDLQEIAEKVRYLISPLNAIRLYVDDIIEDSEYKEIKDRLAILDKAAGKCIVIIKQLAGMTIPYYKSKSNK